MTNKSIARGIGLTEKNIAFMSKKYQLKKSPEHRTKMRRIIGKKAYSLGFGIAGMSKKEKTRVGKLAYSRGIAKLGKERLSEIGKSGAKAMFKKLVKEGKLPALKERMRKMATWHFDKLKKEGKFLEFQHKANKQIPKKDTSIELAFEKELVGRGYKVIDIVEFNSDVKWKDDKDIVVKQYPFEDRFWIDFTFPNRKIAIECWGEFHHVHPKIYDRNNLKYEQQKRKIKSDKVRSDYIKSKSWKIFTFWGNEIKRNVSRCVDKIEKNLER